MSKSAIPHEFLAELENQGEEEVKAKLLRKVYGDIGAKKAFAEDWLAQKDRARRDAIDSESLSTAREALVEARRAADAAESQARTARWALWIAIAAAIIAIIAIGVDIGNAS